MAVNQMTTRFGLKRRTNMITRHRLAAIAVAVITLAVLSPNAGAQIPNQKLRMTISEPLEVPNLVLPSGTYVFEALENGRVTRILSADETHIYTTLLTQPEERRESVETPLVTLKEAPKGEVQRIDSWFFAGESIGNEFLYSGTSEDGESESKFSAFTRDAGHVVASVAETTVEAPEYVALHVGHAIVGSSVATGRFFRANSLVN
jgi:hypothetical protein